MQHPLPSTASKLQAASALLHLRGETHSTEKSQGGGADERKLSWEDMRSGGRLQEWILAKVPKAYRSKGNVVWNALNWTGPTAQAARTEFGVSFFKTDKDKPDAVASQPGFIAAWTSPDVVRASRHSRSRPVLTLAPRTGLLRRVPETKGFSFYAVRLRPRRPCFHPRPRRDVAAQSLRQERAG